MAKDIFNIKKALTNNILIFKNISKNNIKVVWSINAENQL